MHLEVLCCGHVEVMRLMRAKVRDLGDPARVGISACFCDEESNVPQSFDQGIRCALIQPSRGSPGRDLTSDEFQAQELKSLAVYDLCPCSEGFQDIYQTWILESVLGRYILCPFG